MRSIYSPQRRKERKGLIIFCFPLRGPENKKNQLFKGYAGRVEIDLERFAVITYAAIGWIFFLTARISDAGSDDSL